MYLFLWKCLFKAFVCDWIAFLLSWDSPWYILDTNSLSDIICKYFLPFHWLSSHCLDGVLWIKKVCNSSKSPTDIFLLSLMLLPTNAKKTVQSPPPKHLPNLNSPRFMPMFSFRSYTALALTLRSRSHSELNSVYSVKQRPKSILLHVDIQLY